MTVRWIWRTVHDPTQALARSADVAKRVPEVPFSEVGKCDGACRRLRNPPAMLYFCGAGSRTPSKNWAVPIRKTLVRWV